jgi:very-short-patch-repair endonuclease
MREPKTNTTTRARSLRRYDNVSEAKLWEELRARRLNGFKFVRQLPIGRYFADFACRDRKLVIEVDGSQHANSDYDRQRDRFMNAEEWSIVRFWNVAVLTEMESVLETIVAILEGRLNEPEDAPDLKFMPAAEG